MRTRVMEILLVDGMELYADSTSTYKTLDLVVPQLEGLMPHAEKVWVEALLTNCSQDEIDWNVDTYSGFDRDHENAAVAFFAADQSAAGSTRLDAANWTTADYRRHTRLALRWRLHNGVGTPKNGRFSLSMFVQTWGS